MSNEEKPKKELPSRNCPEIEEKITGKTRVFDGRFLKVDQVKVRLPNEHEVIHEVIDHPGAVAILALDDKENVLLERQARTAFEKVMFEVPAGKLEKGEDPLECAKRELAEETGYHAKNIEYLLSIATAAGYSNELLDIYLATDLTSGKTRPDEDEFITTFWLNKDEFIRLVLEGEIQDSKSVVCALWLAQESKY